MILMSHWSESVTVLLNLSLTCVSQMLCYFVRRNHVLSAKKIGMDSDKGHKAYRQRKERNLNLSLMKGWSELVMHGNLAMDCNQFVNKQVNSRTIHFQGKNTRY
jgi:hypothetical protein